MKLALDPLTLDALGLLTRCSEVSSGQLADLSAFIDANKSEIEGSLREGLASEQGAFIALRLLKLQSDRLSILADASHRVANYKRPIDESRFLIAVIGQVFHSLREWMRVNSIDKITADTLPALEEYVSLDLLLQNGHRERVIIETEP